MNISTQPPPGPASRPEPTGPPRKKRKQTRKKKSPPPPPKNPDSSDEEFNATDPLTITAPVREMVHPCLADAWKVNVGNPMHFIFDTASPARHFKRGMKYRPQLAFPAYGNPPYDDLTETDCPPPGFMPFAPQEVECVIPYLPPMHNLLTPHSFCSSNYNLRCPINEATFMKWEFQELRQFQQGHSASRIVDGKVVEEVAWVEQFIPAPYDRILSQLLYEDAHAEIDGAHEALRRQAFVRRVLNEFDRELSDYRGNRKTWRPRSLTPLLVRQLFGVDENYGPSVAAAIAQGPTDPTIAEATDFYLTMDLTNPRWIPNFRRNLVHIPEARWHLGIVLGVHRIGARRVYDFVHRNQDKLTKYFQALAKASGPPAPEPFNDENSDDMSQPLDVTDFPLYSRTEVEVITDEHLEGFFTVELNQVVSTPFLHTDATCADG
jgi:hypothetical protein